MHKQTSWESSAGDILPLEGGPSVLPYITILNNKIDEDLKLKAACVWSNNMKPNISSLKDWADEVVFGTSLNERVSAPS